MIEKLFNSITRGSLRFKWVTITLSVFLMVAGVFAFTQLNQELIPQIEFPQTIILALNPGMDADTMLNEVTMPLEEALSHIEDVVNVETTTSSGLSVTVVRNDFGLDQEEIRAQIQAVVDAIELPEGMEKPDLLTFSFSDLPLASISISSEGSSLQELKDLVEAKVVPELELIAGVAAVNISGGQELPAEEEEVAVEQSPEPTQEPTEEPTVEPTEEPPVEGEVESVAMPDSWIAAMAAQGFPITTVDQLNSMIIAGFAASAPEMLDELTPEMVLAMPVGALAALPEEFIASMSPEVQAQLMEKLASTAPPVVEEETHPSTLPAAWQAAGEAQGIPLNTVDDLTPELIQGFASFAPEMLDLLTPDNLLLMAPEVLAVLPEDYIASLDAGLQAELDEIVQSAAIFIPTTTINRANGNPSLGMSIFMDKEANTVSVSHEVFEKLDELEAADLGLEFEIVFEQASFIEESISGVTREGGLGAIFAVIVILSFLSGRSNGKFKLSWRSTLVAGLSIPLSVFMAFTLFKWLPVVSGPIFTPLVDATKDIAVLGGFINALATLFTSKLTLNIMTLSGMTVAVGRVVDDSIVVLENIYRHIQRGDDQRTSVLKGTRDVSIAIFASTVTTVVVFLPIGLMGGLVGEFFMPFGIAVTYALSASFLVAITIVPLLAFLFIRKEHLPPAEETRMQKIYSPILSWALGHKGATLAIAGVLLIGSVFLFGTRPQAFMPDFGDVRISTTVDLPDEYTMADTNALTMEFEEAIFDIEGIGSVLTKVGSGGGMESIFLGSAINQTAATISIGIENAELAAELTPQIRQEAEKTFGVDHVVVSAGSLSSQGFGGFALVASAENFVKLVDFNDTAIQSLNDVDGLANISSNLYDTGTFLRVDGEPAIRFGGELETKDSLRVTNKAREALAEIAPAGITISEGFESQMQSEGFAQTFQAIGISIGMVYLVMVLTFNSFIYPFTILFSLPLAVIGAAVALWLSDSILGLSSMVGMMMLVGIVVTNAIVLVSRVQVNRKERGLETKAALLEAGRTRLRPILMTAIAAILALVPLAIGFSEGAIIASELAIVVIGGLTTSTFLTLLIVPVMFSLLDRFSKNAKKGKEKKAS